MTGGDVLMRRDVVDVVAHARSLGVPVAIAPSVTPRLRPRLLQTLRRLGVKVASVSLDGARPETHESLRGIAGHFQETLRAIDLLRSCGFTVQVNTVVRPENLDELAETAEIVRARGAAVWELFFLVPVGRGDGLQALPAETNEAVCHFLYDASRYGFIVRTVEAPFFRRVVASRRAGEDPPATDAYDRLSRELRRRLGDPRGAARAQTKGTRDGKGIVFVAHDGDVYPAGFLPLAIGNVVRDDLADLYRSSPLLRDIRAARFSGRCGRCAYRDLCGGSRARAYAMLGDPLGEDPGCAYEPLDQAERSGPGRVHA